jgi:AcrR family transcriptional regulator
VTASPHERILEAATRLFVEEGVCAVGMSRIAAEARVAPMTVYRHFHSKERLVAAVVEGWSAGSLRWLAGRLDRPGETPESYLQALWDLLEAWLAKEEAHASLPMRVANELRGQGDHPAVKAVEAHRVAMRELLEDLAGRAGAVDPARVAAQLLFLLEAAALLDALPVGTDDLRMLAGGALS